MVSGERIIVNRSNFGIPCLPNGEIGKVIEYYPETIEKIADFHFAEALFEFEDIDGEKRQFIKMFNLDYLMEGVPEDNSKKIHSLWHDRYRQNKLFRETKKAYDDPYLSALDIRYGYVLTTHKAQGGEWDQVIMHPEIPNNFDRLKWLYTAVSRAKSEFCMYNNY